MNRRHETHSDHSAYRSCHLPLVHVAESGFAEGHDAAHWCDVLGEHGEVLGVLVFNPYFRSSIFGSLFSRDSAGKTYAVFSLWVDFKHITNIHPWLPPPLPLLHLHITQIMRRIHITRLPPAANLFRQFQCLLMLCQFFRTFLGIGMSGVAPGEARRVVAVVWTRALC